MAFSTFLGDHPANLALAMCKQVALQDLDVATGPQEQECGILRPWLPRPGARLLVWS